MSNMSGFKILIAVFAVLTLFCFTINAAGIESQYNISPVTNRSYLDTCIRIINSSSGSISIAHFYLKDDPVTRNVKIALRKAAQRNVKIRILLDESLPDNASFMKEFSASGIEIKLDHPQKKLHAKLILIDDNIVLLGSTNFSEKSINFNNETNVLIENNEIAALFQNYFDKLWHKETVEDKYFANAYAKNRILIPLSGSDYFNSAVRLLNGAKNEVAVMLYMARFMPKYYSSKSNRLLRALCEARRKGARVRVLLEKSDFDIKLNEMNTEAFNYLSENNIEVKYDPPDTISHAKLLLCDNEAIIGSSNWVNSGLGTNNEANILIRDGSTVKYFWDYFEKLWDTD